MIDLITLSISISWKGYISTNFYVSSLWDSEDTIDI